MPRHQRCRRICEYPACESFSPEKNGSNQTVTLTLDEYEVLRLVDFERQTHEQCAQQMDISRTTVTEIYDSARYKVADSIVNGKRLLISGGNYRLCDGTGTGCCRQECPRRNMQCGRACPETDTCCGMNQMKEKRTQAMKVVAVTYENGEIFQHFGHTAQFKIYEIADGRVNNSRAVSAIGSGHGALAGFLQDYHVDTLICGGIGGGAQEALAQAGIELFGGVSGNADEAVNALIAGTLSFDPEVHCDHHDHEGGCHGEEHSCHEEDQEDHQCGGGCGGNHGCGCH